MRLDLRLPIGILFSLFGAILIGTGLLAPASANQQSLGINMNLWWGLVLLVFGVVMFAFAMRGRTRGKTP